MSYVEFHSIFSSIFFFLLFIESVSNLSLSLSLSLSILRNFNCYMIVHYQFLLSIVNVAMCDYFILLSLNNIYLFLCSCYYFYKNIFN